MRKMKKIMALALAMVMVIAMALPVSASSYGVANTHTITINNSDANGEHTYEGYQVFKGNLNASEAVLSDIEWGEGVDGAAILTALITANADSSSALSGKFADLHEADPTSTPAKLASTAAEVAKDIADLGDNSAELDAVARIISEHLTSTKYTFNGSKAAGYKATVPSDGYYFIKDTTSTLPDGDTASKFILEVVKDIEVNAKDTSIAPDKEITGGETNVKAGTAAVGDPVNFQVAIQIPDTTTFKKDFWFIMNDTLPTGMTFMQVDSVKTYAAADIDTEANYKVKSGAQATATLTTPVADVNSQGYTVTVAPAGSDTYATYTKPADNDAAVAAAGGQKIRVTFNEFKDFAETEYVTGKNHIGEYVVVTYTAVVNDDAVYGSTGNKNEVTFTYSTDPNHDYDGDEPGPESTDPTGTTPNSETTTYVAGIEILKVDGGNSNSPLANAEFEIASDDYTRTVTKGVKYEKAPYTAQTGEKVESGDYWKLKDGSFTAQNPNTPNMNQTQYDNPNEKYVKVSWEKIVVDPGTQKKVTFITGSDGIIDVKGLNTGTYTIKETHAPDGYNKINDEIKIVIDWDKASDGKTGEFKLGDGTSESVTLVADGDSAKAIYKIQVVNNKGSELPSTGGIGTTMFYLMGAVLAIGAGVVLVARRRMGVN